MQFSTTNTIMDGHAFMHRTNKQNKQQYVRMTRNSKQTNKEKFPRQQWLTFKRKRNKIKLFAYK